MQLETLQNVFQIEPCCLANHKQPMETDSPSPNLYGIYEWDQLPPEDLLTALRVPLETIRALQ